LCLETLEDRCLLSGNVLQTNLVSDLPGVAKVLDPNLANPWGIAESPTSPFWISDNNSGLSTLYNTPGNPQSLVEGIPGPGKLAGEPTGTVFNIAMGNNAFLISNGGNSAPAIFLFATQNGTIAGWNPTIAGTHAVIAVDSSYGTDGAVYTGLAIATDAYAHTLLYVANFRAGRIDVFNADFQPASLPADAFFDPQIPNGYAPFNVQAIGNQIYVTYAYQNAAKDQVVNGPNYGFIDVFNFDGSGGHRLVSGGPLNSPWGMAIAPASLGNFAGDLLVGNFGDGHINVFDPQSGNFLGMLKDSDGDALQINGLWALTVGNGTMGGDQNTIYFTAGIDNEQHGLFGSLTADANPSSDDYASDPATESTDSATTPFIGPSQVSSGSSQLADPGTNPNSNASYYPQSTDNNISSTPYQAGSEVKPYQVPSAGETGSYGNQLETVPIQKTTDTSQTLEPLKINTLDISAPQPLITGRPVEVAKTAAIEHLANGPINLVTINARTAADDFGNGGPDQTLTALVKEPKSYVEGLVAAASTTLELQRQDPPVDNLRAGSLNVDLANLKEAVDRFFAHLGNLADQWTGSPDSMTLMHWLLAGATATGIFEWARRKSMSLEEVSHRDPDDPLWDPFPVPLIYPPEDQP